MVSDFGAINNTMASTPELSHLFVEAMEYYHQLSADEDVYSESFGVFLETEKLDRKVASYHEISNLASSLPETDHK